MGGAAVDERTVEGPVVTEDLLRANASDLENEIAWFSTVLDARLKLYFGEDVAVDDVFEIAPPDLDGSDSAYAQFIAHYRPSFTERTALVLALVPHIRPQLLDVFFTKNQKFDRPFTEFGGAGDGPRREFAPTGETLAFVLCGTNLETRFALHSMFDDQHYFARHNILRLAVTGVEHPSPKSCLELSEEVLSYLTTGELRRPNFGASFPARYMTTELTWDDLVLHPGTRRQVEEIETWLKHGDTLMDEWGMSSKLRPGYRALFYGPPGTGKTMTACLLGKYTERDVYKVDLSLVVSKYIGETEKNLGKVFDQAEHKGWILFFDEADALFGKRSEAKDAHDRYANQEVSFLLQRIETFDGIAILASNQRENLDEAFSRRFEAIIFFPTPRPEERLQLWRQAFPPAAELAATVDLHAIADAHSLSGGSIMNVVRFASLEALKEGTNVITTDSVLQGIRREYAKDGKGA